MNINPSIATSTNDLVSAQEKDKISAMATQEKTKELSSTDFFKLLAVQLTNQDPMEPMDNTDFVAQMAQFSALANSNDQLGRLDKILMALEDLGNKKTGVEEVKKLDEIKTSIDLLREESRSSNLRTAASAA